MLRILSRIMLNMTSLIKKYKFINYNYKRIFVSVVAFAIKMVSHMRTRKKRNDSATLVSTESETVPVSVEHPIQWIWMRIQNCWPNLNPDPELCCQFREIIIKNSCRENNFPKKLSFLGNTGNGTRRIFSQSSVWMVNLCIYVSSLACFASILSHISMCGSGSV